MRSGNGKHRRPRQAPAVLVSAGATGAGLALPLLGTGAAQAADATTWDRVAQCESGGLWSANLGNGYYGGLQITVRTWQKYGGTAYAERPDLASRSQQIAVAERILAAEGPEAWPRCAERADLTTAETTAPGVDPGLELPPLDLGGDGRDTTAAPDDGAEEDADATSTPTPGEEPSQDARPDEERAAGSATPTPGATGRPPADTTDGVFDPEGTAARPGGSGGVDVGEGTGRHRGPRDPREVAQEQRERQRAADRADRHTAGPRSYVVRPGDCLSVIAERYDLTGGWPALYEANRDVIGEDPDLILPGQRFDLTGGEDAATDGADAGVSRR